MHNDTPLDMSTTPDAAGPRGLQRRIVQRRIAQCRGVMREFARTRQSAVATELAIIALPFFLLLLGTLEVGFDTYVQAALNGAVILTARDISDGAAQSYDTSQGGTAKFVPNYMCPHLGGLLECGNIQVNIQRLTAADLASTASGFYTAVNTATPYITGLGTAGSLQTAGWSVCTGGENNPVYFQAVYIGPTFVGGLAHSFVVTYKGGLIHPTYASEGFVNQGFVATVSC